MTLTRLVQLAAAGILLGITSLGLAQSTSMESRQGWRHAGRGAVTGSTSTFSVGITRDGGQTYVSSASTSETVQIRGVIHPEVGDLGSTANIYVVDRVLNGPDVSDDQYFMLVGTSWIPWLTVNVADLQPFKSESLDSSEILEIFSGALGITGDHKLFLGYWPPNGALRYHFEGVPFTVTAGPAQSPEVAAQALFAAKISTSIVQDGCIVCHMDGSTAGHTHVFVQGSSSTALATNFNVFRGLMGRGKAYILGKTSGTILHEGGTVFPANTQQYRDLDEFLTLLEQL